MVSLNLDLHNPHDLLIILLTLSISFIAYFTCYFLFNWERIKIKHLFLVILTVNFIFLFIPFITSNDLYSYIFQTRILPIFGNNPYLIPYDAFKYDSLYNAIKTIWSSQTTLHGPLFLLIGGIINSIAKSNLILIIFLFKFMLIVANTLNTHLIYLISKNKRAMFLYGLNPLVIFELAGNAHADSLLILFLLISILFTKQDKPISSHLMLIASGLIKYSTFVLIPYELLYFKTKGIKTIILTITLGALMIILIYLPFWNGLKIFNYLINYYNGKYISPSLGIAVGKIIFGSYKTSFHINTIIFLLIFSFLCIRIILSKPNFGLLVFYSFIIYWVYLLTKLSLVQAWDLTPLIALASLCVVWKKYQKPALTAIFFTTIYSTGLYYFIR